MPRRREDDEIIEDFRRAVNRIRARGGRGAHPNPSPSPSPTPSPSPSPSPTPPHRQHELHFREWYSKLNIADMILPIALLLVGFTVAQYFGNTFLMLGFLSWVLYLLMPRPDDFNTPPVPAGLVDELDEIADSGGKGTPGRAGVRVAGKKYRQPFWSNAFGFRSMGRELAAPHHTTWRMWDAPGRHHVRASWLRTIFKVMAIIFLALGFVEGSDTNTIPFANILLLGILIGGYFNMGVRYNINNPSEYISSLGRFVLGITLIPFAFVNIFDSWLIAIVAWAFFAIPPVRQRETEGSADMFEMPLKIIFFILMGAALIMSGALAQWGLPSLVPDSSWQLTGVLATVFLYFWLVSFIAGFFSPASTRPYTGFIMIGAVIVIFALGPGSGDVGQALLGQWFPTVSTAFDDIGGPFGDVFKGISNTVGQAFELLACPNCFAQKIINGSYNRDPETGLVGALGVEIERVSLSPIFVGQPYTVSLTVTNKGSSHAKNVTIFLSPGKKAPKEELTPLGEKLWPRFGARLGETIIMEDLGFVSYDGIVFCDPFGCQQKLDTTNQTLRKIDARQIFFETRATDEQEIQTGISCAAVATYELREKPIPYNVSVSYGYETSSQLDIEVMSAVEWDRTVREGELVVQRKKGATITNSPIKLNIDTLEQPLRQGTPVFIGANIVSSQPLSSVYVNTLTLEIPKFFGTPQTSRCFPQPSRNDPDGDIHRLVWTNSDLRLKTTNEPTTTVQCNLGRVPNPLAPTRTLLVKAHADYTFTKSVTKQGKLEFGGAQCCTAKGKAGKAGGCPDGFVCQNDYTCGIGSGNTTTPPQITTKRNFAQACNPTIGCHDEPQQTYDVSSAGNPIKSIITCRSVTVSGVTDHVCCQKEASDQQCVTAYTLGRQGKSASEITTQQLSVINKSL